METMHENCRRFLDQLHGQSTANQRLYRQRLKYFLSTYGHMAPADLTPRHVNQWYAAINDSSRGLATLAGYRQAIKAYCAWMVREQLVSVDPARHLRAGRYISTRPRTPSEMDLLATLAIAKHWQTGTPLQRRDAALFILSTETGARVGGLCAIHLNAAQLALTAPDPNGVYALTTTSKSRELILEFTYYSGQAILSWLEVRPDQTKSTRLFCGLTPPFNNLNTELACRGYQRLSLAAGVPTITSHSLRHRIGTIYTRAYDPKIAALKLGHSDASTTAATAIAYYYRPDRAQVSAATAALAPGAQPQQTIHNRLSSPALLNHTSGDS